MFGERGANKSVIRPMAAWRLRCVVVGASRRSDRFKSLAHISKRGGSITSFAICQHCQNRVVAYRISKSASELLSAISHRSVTTLDPVEPSRVQRLPTRLVLTIQSPIGVDSDNKYVIQEQLCEYWDLDWGIEVLQETVFRSCAQQ
jgi:hypothetical protein